MSVFSHHDPLRYLVPIGGALVAGAVGVAAYTAYELNGAQRRHTYADPFSPWEAQVDYEDVSFTGQEGICLRGWWLSRPETRNVILCLCGHRSPKSDLLGIGIGLWRAGNNVLLFDYRGCGASDPGPQSLGHYELNDAQAALQYIRDRLPEAQIGCIGYSMGAAVAILLTSTDSAIRALVVDSPFATMRDVVAAAYQRHRLPARPLLHLCDALSRWWYGYSFADVRPLDVISRIAPRPLFMLHSSRDRVIPLEHSQRLFAAAGEPKELWLLDEVPHCCGYFADPPGYVARIAAFFKQALGDAPTLRAEAVGTGVVRGEEHIPHAAV
jgi:dienelactone hydrolase